MRVRAAGIDDLQTIVSFIAEEAREAEDRAQDLDTLERGIGAALDDPSIARYWLLVDDADVACGCTSVVKEWSDWNAGYYWWIQSMYIAPEHRGQGHLDTLLDAVRDAGQEDGCLELRLCVLMKKRISAKRLTGSCRDRLDAYRIVTSSSALVG